MANILFVDKGIPSIGIAYMASFLKKYGHRVHYLRASLKSMFSPNVEIDVDSYIKNKLGNKVDIFCFSVMAIDWGWVKGKISILKKKYPKTPILVGGSFATLSPEVILRDSEADYVCNGDGEKPLLAIAQSLDSKTLVKDVEAIDNIGYKKNGESVIKDMSYQVDNLDDYPFPDFSIYHGQFSRDFFVNPRLITSRGCSFSCTYCSCPNLNKLYSKTGKFVRRHSVPYMIEFLSKMKDAYKSKNFTFNDDIFFLDKKWLKDFAREYKKKINVPNICIGNPNFIDDEVAESLKEIRCRLVILGLQSGSEEVRKKLRRSESNSKVVEITRCLKKASVSFSINHIFDLPFDTVNNIQESAGLYNKVRPNMLDTFSLAYFPKAEIIKDAVAAGRLSEEDVIQIESGKCSGQINPYKHQAKTNYQCYNLFFNMIPVLPKKVINFLISPKRFQRVCRLFSYLPGEVSALIKLCLAFKNHTQFIQTSAFHEIIFYINYKWQFKLRNVFTSLSQKYNKNTSSVVGNVTS
ncbi:MAG: B12-binding domain-containing radical SAM protein [PVC group bacterium]|nr:B12-binding domain-containing radical SAM protein [PVC group bacterium]